MYSPYLGFSRCFHFSAFVLYFKEQGIALLADPNDKTEENRGET